MRSASLITAGSSSASDGHRLPRNRLSAASRVSGTVVVSVAEAGSAIAHRKRMRRTRARQTRETSRNARAHGTCRSAISVPAIAPAASGTVLEHIRAAARPRARER